LAIRDLYRGVKIMPIRESDILKMLEANYKSAVELIPPDLVQEFQKKILRPDELKEYGKSINVAYQFKDPAAMLKIQNWMADHFDKGGFGRKLMASGTEPSRVYERLMKGFIDY